MQNVISTSDIPFVTVAFKGVVLLDGCLLCLSPTEGDNSEAMGEPQ